MTSGWIGVDLDGTLAEYHGWTDGTIGKPVPAMLARVKTWLAEGRDVRIFTARVFKPEVPARYPAGGGDPDDSAERAELQRRVWFAEEQHKNIDKWCIQHLGRPLPVTCSKDFSMIELWDDRCVSVEMNTGRIKMHQTEPK